MNESIYAQYVNTYFPALVTSIVEKLNEKNTPLQYLYKTLLEPVYSADGRWASILAEYTRVAADVVALDSELPLKSRDIVEHISGEIPKIGLKLYLTEKQMKDLDAMIALNQPLTRILRFMFADTQRVIEAIWERLEDLFLSELSTGVAVSERNNGTGVRLDMGFLASHQKKSTTAWSGNQSTSTPMDDIQKVFDQAMEDDNIISDIYADDAWLQAFYQAKQVRGQFAFNNGIGLTADGVPVLDFDKAAQVILTKWGVTLHRVARKVKTEINGKKQNHNPWKTGSATFTCDPIVGSLVWTTCAEADRPVGGVAYETADEYILVSRYSKNDPLREFTASQAMAVPVLNNVDRIYTLDATYTEG